jgi:hypothetical protein
LALNVKHVAMAGRVAPCDFLPGTQTLPGICDRIIRLQPLLGDVEQMHAPRIGIAMLGRSQEIAVARCGIDAGQHRHGALKDFVVQAYADARQVLCAIDRAGLLRSPFQHLVNSADADGDPQEITQELHDTAE